MGREGGSRVFPPVRVATLSDPRVAHVIHSWSLLRNLSEPVTDGVQSGPRVLGDPSRGNPLTSRLSATRSIGKIFIQESSGEAVNMQRQKQKMVPWWIAALLFGGLLAALPPISFAARREIASLDSSLKAVGFVKFDGEITAPDFTLSDLSGKPVRLADLRGKVGFLTFWATWCPYCQREFPSLERLHEQFRKKDFVVLAVNIAEQPDRVKKYVMEHKLTFPALLDSNGRVSALYGVRGTPTRFLINRQGNIIAGSIGPRDWASEEAQKLIRNLLGPGV